MFPVLSHADELLRGRELAAVDDRRAGGTLYLALMVALFGVFYGAVMGTFGGVQGQRALQLLYSGVKVPILFLVTFCLSLPSFFVLNTLLGVRADFAQALRALVATQAAVTIVLASLAPFTALWYVSSAAYHPAVLFNAAMFGVASVSAQGLLRRWYAPLIARNPRHRVLLRVWLIIYAFVGVQMAWVLRPFVGDPNQPTHFFREGAWGNAYVEVARMVMDVLR
jgi:hypothetical protein